MLSRAQVRDFDRRAITEFGLPAIVLMENAGRGAAELLLSLGVRGLVAICCYKGNNGGDGMVMARHLHNHDVSVAVHLFCKPEDLSGEAAVHWNVTNKMALAAQVWPEVDDGRLLAELAKAEWVVDALLGTGLEGPARPPLDRVITTINASSAHVFAVDIPSGLNADTGEPMGPTIRADHTATFVDIKTGFVNPVAHDWLGQVHIVDIGIVPNGAPASI